MLCPKCNSAGCEEDCIDSYEIYLFDEDDEVIAYKEVFFEKHNPPSKGEVKRRAERFKKDYISKIRYDFSS